MTETQQWIDFALQQVAAESYLDDISFKNEEDVLRRLIVGANNYRVPPDVDNPHATRMTKLQADYFLENFEIIDHLPNRSSGFSATLTFNNNTKEYTLSFRSTEFRLPDKGGDKYRDGLEADVSIALQGFALAQLASMEDYYAWLKSSGTLSSDAVLNVTGYSLGGHLATLFTEMHTQDVKHAYNFNAVGRGDYNRSVGTLRDMITEYRSELRKLNIGNALPADIFDIKASIGLKPGQQQSIYTVSELKAHNAIIDKFSAQGTIAIDKRERDDGIKKPSLDPAVDRKIVQIFGHATHSDLEVVATAGVSSSSQNPIFIEDQPERDPADFGTTHSIILIIDSLTLTELFQSIDPTLSRSDTEGIFAAASNARASSISFGVDGRVEYDSLENALDVLRRTFISPNVLDTRSINQTGAYGDITLRNAFYNNIDTLKKAIAGKTYRIERLDKKSSSELVDIATSQTSQGLAYRYALTHLNPFAVLGDSSLYDAGALSADNFSAQYMEDRALLLSTLLDSNVANEGGDTFNERTLNQTSTAPYIIDRYNNGVKSFSLKVENHDTTNDPFSKLFSFKFKNQPTLSDPNTKHSHFVEDGVDTSLTGSIQNDHLYGNLGDDTLRGMGGDDYLEGGSGTDKLDGGTGIDRLIGGKGNDTLDGGRGNDKLEGGQGQDIYIYNSQRDGVDNILDSDGLGTILWDGMALNGGKRQSDGSYQSDDQTIKYVFTPDAGGRETLTITNGEGKLRVLNYKFGELGLSLDQQPVPEPTVSDAHNASDSGDQLISQNHSANNQLTGGRASDDLNGRNGDDILNGGAGNDWIHAGSDDDLISGGAGNDAIFAGSGSNTVLAGDGNDVVISKSNFGFHAQLNQNHNAVYANWNLDATNIWRHGWSNAKVIYAGLSTSNDHHYELSLRPVYSSVPVSGQPLDVATQRYSYVQESDSKALLEISSAQFSGTDHYRLSFTREATVDTAAQTINGGAGNDTLAGNAGSDLIIGGADNDVLAGYEGSDDLFGGSGDDKLFGGHGNDLLDGGEEQDLLVGESGQDNLYGGRDNDILWGDSDILPEHLHGDDYLDGGSGDDSLYGGGGDDVLLGGSGNDTLWGDAGNDDLSGGAGDDILNGDDHATPVKLQGTDTLHGGAGRDQLYGFGGDDILHGDSGEDDLVGGNGSDQLHGGTQADNLRGGSGEDWLFGEHGDDSLHGDANNDVLVGGSGNDKLYGGSGTDTFVFRAGDGLDVLYDGDGADKIRFEGIGKNALSTQVINNKNGDAFLALKYGDSDTVYIKDGLRGAIQKIYYGENGVLSIQDLIGDTLTQPLNYRLDKSGTAYGGIADDTLLGSAGVDTLYGGRGNDTLAGGAGSDTLIGGLGNDTYVFGRGSGRNRVIEQDGESNTIRLWANTPLTQIVTEQQGQNLFVHIQGTSDGLIIEDYFTSSPEWRVETQDGQVALLSEITANSAASVNQPASIEEAKDLYKSQVENFYGGVLTVNGFQLGQDGIYRKSLTRPDISSGTTRQETVFHYQLGIDYATENSNTANIYRNAPNLDTQSVFQNQSSTSKSVSILDTTNGTYSSAPQSNGVFVDLDQLHLRNSSGIGITAGTLEPVYGANGSFDPLTGIYGQEVLGYWIFKDTNAAAYLTRHVQLQRNETQVKGNLLIAEINAGNDDNRVVAGSETGQPGGLFNLVDGGAGNDTLTAAAKFPGSDPQLIVPGGDANGLVNIPGSLLYGNDGNDTLIGSGRNDVLIGGKGLDSLRGGRGNDRYILFSGDDESVVFDDGKSLSGVHDEDIIQLPQGVVIDDLSYSWGEVLTDSPMVESNWPGRTQSLHTTLEITWGTNERLTIILPHTDLGVGFGVDFVEFSDSSRVEFSELVNRAGPNPGFDPHQRGNVLTGKGPLFGGDGDDRLTSTEVPESTGFQDPADLLLAQNIDFDAPRLIGGAGYDTLIGGRADDKLYGGSIIHASLADLTFAVGGLWDSGNLYQGNEGNDTIWTTAGADIIQFGVGDGVDEVTDLYHHDYFPPVEIGNGPAIGSTELNQLFPELQDAAVLLPVHRDALLTNQDTVRFNAGIETTDIGFERQENDLYLRVNQHDGLVFKNWYTAEFNQFGRIEFADGTVYQKSDIQQLISGQPINRAPIVRKPIIDRAVDTNTRLSFSLPPDAFADPEGDTLNFSGVSLSDGSPLPGWLNFDPQTRTFSGTPQRADEGIFDIRVTVSDNSGLTTSDNFALTVTRNRVAKSSNIAPPTSRIRKHFNIFQAGSGRIFLIGRSGNDQIRGGTGSEFLLGGAGDDQLQGEKGNDVLYGNHGHDRLDGGTGNDKLWGGRGNDRLDGAGGNDRLFGNHGHDRLDGGTGNDKLRGGRGNDRLYGAGGNDRLFGNHGHDRLDGGTGNDKLRGGRGNDRLYGAGGNDRLFGNHGHDRLDGGTGNDKLWGGRGNDRLDGAEGNDVLFGNHGHDRLDGGTGNDKLWGGRGNDRLRGGVGADRLIGGEGADHYLFSRNDGQDIIQETDQTAGAQNDILKFNAGVDHDQLWFSRSRNDLNIQIIGTHDRITIDGWYSSPAKRIEVFQSGDNFSTTDTQVDLLVQAMAAFNPPPSGQLELSPGLHSQLTPTLAASWQDN